MSQVTTYKCDVCGKETTREDLETVGIGIKKPGSYSYPSLNYYDAQQREKDMCKECRKTFGIDSVEKKPNVPEPTYPTLEDMIREIVHQEIGNR